MILKEYYFNTETTNTERKEKCPLEQQHDTQTGHKAYNLAYSILFPQGQRHLKFSGPHGPGNLILCFSYVQFNTIKPHFVNEKNELWLRGG